MKPVKAFILQYCPYCQKAKRAYAELSEQYPVPFEWIDEAKEAALADQYDYYYTPTFYVDETKVFVLRSIFCAILECERPFRVVVLIQKIPTSSL